MTIKPAFEPNKVPVQSTDDHLPRVSAEQMSVAALMRRFADPPHWVPELSVEARFSDRAPTPAAVLVPLVMRDQITVLLTTRTAHLSSHSGQVAFPGGKADIGDENATATALREAQEEIGLEPAFVRVIGSFPVYATGSGFLVTPVFGLLQPGFSIAPNPNEVADVFEVPLEFLMNPANHRHHIYDWSGQTRHWISMSYQEGEQERFIWGATAGMLRNFYRFLLASDSAGTGGVAMINP